MAIGYASLGRCFVTHIEAAEHLCRTSYPLAGISGSTMLVASCEVAAVVSPTASRITIRTTSSTGAGSVTTRNVSFLTCDTDQSVPPFNLSAVDGLLIAGAIVGVWAAAYAWKAAKASLGTNDAI